MHQKYKKTLKSGRSRPSTGDSANRVWWSSRHCEQDVAVSDTSHAVPSRSSQKLMTLYSRIARLGRHIHDRLLHSIPSKKSLGNKQLRCFSLCIPLVCMLVLFGLLNVSLSLGSEFSNEVYAAEGDSGNSDKDGKLSVIISGDLEQTTPAVAGETAYRSHNVQVNGSNIDSYTMQISYGSGSSTLENTPMLEGTESTVIEGANGRTSSNTDDNWWGYSWDDNDKTEDTLTFQTMPQYGNGAQLEGGKPSDGTVSVDKTLTFAAKFGSDATAGHYKADVLLSLAASPKKVVSEGLGSIEYMQDVTPELCAKTPDDWTGTLIDKRGTDPSKYITYTVAKLADDNCWMTQNLRLTGVTLTSVDSDVSSDYPLTATYVSKDDDYGAHYDFATATAGTASSGQGDASSSICPKGWKLPSNYGNGSYQTLYDSGGNSDWIFAGNPGSVNDKAGRMIGSGFFSAAGLDNGANASIVGYYWSRTAKDNSYAYYLHFDSSTVNPQSADGYRATSFSVRCVAEAPSFGDTGITYMQEMTADVCNSVATGTKGSLIDKRDGKLYSVAKIANKTGSGENCWMTQNLQLDLEQYWNKETMVMSLSDVPSDSYWTQRNIGAAKKKNQGFTISSSDYNAIEYTNTTMTGSAENQLKINSDTYDPSYGYYYTWCAATVGCKNSSGGNPGSGVDAVASICPKGWQLPSGNTNGQWYNLLNGMNRTSIAAEPYKIPAAGYMHSGGFSNGGASGNYWSRTAYDTISAYNPYFNSSIFYPGTNYDYRYNGYSVRCVAVSN